MNYENKPCPACGAHLHEEDDVVVCPICATPQHRKCWLENGACINEAKHSEGYIWSPDNTPADFEPTFKMVEEKSELRICPVCKSESPSDLGICGTCGYNFNGAENKEEQNEKIHCNICGTDNDKSSGFCSKCGAPIEFSESTFNNIHYPKYAENTFDPDERLGTRTAGEIAVYVRTSAHKYLDKFRKFEYTGKKTSFNWAAFFFGPLWFFYRKMYKYGVLVMVCLAAASLVLASSVTAVDPYYNQMNEVYGNSSLSQEEKVQKINEISAEIAPVVAKPLMVTLGLYLAIGLACGFLGYKLYYKKILDDYDVISHEVEDKNMRIMLIQRRGGVSVLNAVCGIFIYRLVATGLVWVADKLATVL